MFNIGFGEILLIAVIGLLVFGPDRLPDAVRRVAGMLRQVRELAAAAREQVVDAAGIDDAESARVLSDLRDLDPRRIASSVLEPEPPSHAPRHRSTGLDPGAL